MKRFVSCLLKGGGIVYLFLFCKIVDAQPASGLETVIDNDEVVFFDYRFHRNPARVYQQLINGNAEFLTSKKATILYHGYSIATYDRGKFVPNIVKNDQPVSYRIDFSVKPIIAYSFGNYSNPVKTQISLSPSLKIIPTKGLYGVLQWNFPVQNDFKGKYVAGQGQRPEQFGFGYDYLWKGRNILAAYLGTFTNRQYGFNLEYLGISPDNSWYFGGAFFYTGPYVYHEMYLYREAIRTFSGYLQLAYRIKAIDLTIRTIGDLYLNGERGGTLEVVRQFGDTDVGFYGIATKGASSGGLLIRIPLWPGRIWSNDWIQFRTHEQLEQYYNVRNTSAMPRTRNYRALLPDMMRFNMNFLNNQLQYSH